MTEDEEQELQRERERLAVTKAVARLRERVESDPAHSPVGVALIRKHWDRLSRAISDAQSEVRTSSHRPLEGPLLLALPADALAVIVLKTIIEKVAETKTEEIETEDKFTALARKIGTRCERQWFRSSPEKQQRAILNSVGVATNDSAARIARQRTEKILRDDWAKSERDLHLGAELIALAVNVGFITLNQERSPGGKPKGPKRVAFTAEVRHSLQWRRDLESLALPFHLPMICKPNPWYRLKGGGYLTDVHEQEMHLVKHWGNPKIIEGLEVGDYTVILQAVDALQEIHCGALTRRFTRLLKKSVNTGRAERFPRNVSLQSRPNPALVRGSQRQRALLLSLPTRLPRPCILFTASRKSTSG